MPRHRTIEARTSCLKTTISKESGEHAESQETEKEATKRGKAAIAELEAAEIDSDDSFNPGGSLF